MVIEVAGTNAPVDTIGAEDCITVDELMSRLRPTFEDAHKKGWAKWTSANERPPSYDAGLSDFELLRVLNVFKNDLTSFRPPESAKTTRSPPSDNTHITGDWVLPSRQVAEILERLKPLFDYNGQQDAAAHWRHCEGRLTFEEVFQRMRRTGKDVEVLLAKLVEAAREGHLRTYAPGCDFRTGQVLQDEIYASDLDAWLEANEPHTKFRFSAPPDHRNMIVPVSRNVANKARLLAAIRECGGDPNNIPNGKKSGLPGLKLKVRKHVGKNLTEATFNYQWKQMLRDAKKPPQIK